MKLPLILLLSTLLSPTGMRITDRWPNGFCDIRGDCWWNGKLCHGCGVSETRPLITNRLENWPWLLDQVKSGNFIYVAPFPKLPIPEGLR